MSSFKCSAYIANVFIHGSFKSIRDSVLNGDMPDYTEAFREPVEAMIKDGQSARDIRSCILEVLHMVPRMNTETRSAIYREVSTALVPKKVGVRVSYETWADDATLDRLIIQSL